MWRITRSICHIHHFERQAATVAATLSSSRDLSVGFKRDTVRDITRPRKETRSMCDENAEAA